MQDLSARGVGSTTTGPGQARMRQGKNAAHAASWPARRNATAVRAAICGAFAYNAPEREVVLLKAILIHLRSPPD